MVLRQTHGFVSGLDGVLWELLQQEHEQLPPFLDTGVEE